MGGRGGKSGFSSTPGGGRTAADTVNINDLSTYMGSKYYMRLNAAGLASADFEAVKAAAVGVEGIIKAFPQAEANFREIAGADLKSGVYAQASFDGVITLARAKYKDHAALLSSYSGDTKAGFHPGGSTADHIAVHEAGHILERALIDKYVMSQGNGLSIRVQGIQAWNKHTYASKVITEAVRIAKKTPTGKGLKTADLIRSVSKYATTNRSETMAECVADYAANGSSAKPLSIAVWQVLKKELG